MATRVNLLDHAPEVTIRGLNWALARFEDPVGLQRPLWRDLSRHQGWINPDVMEANGVLGVCMRAAVSWGYEDPRFREYWQQFEGRNVYRTSYHVLYPSEPVMPQADKWFQVHPERDVLPRVIDLELRQNQPPAVIADVTWQMSEIVLQRDGIRPIIYSRYMLVNEWLSPYWSPAMLHEHYWWLAQYLWDRTREHPGPPTLPNGVLRERVLLHQTADKKLKFPGESESKEIDWDRWTLGDEAFMRQFIESEFGGGTPPGPRDWYEDIHAWATTQGWQPQFPPPES